MHPGTGTKAVYHDALKNVNVNFCPMQHLKAEGAAVKLK